VDTNTNNPVKAEGQLLEEVEALLQSNKQGATDIN